MDKDAPSNDPSDLRIDLSQRLPPTVASLLGGLAWRVLSAPNEAAADVSPTAEVDASGSRLHLRAPPEARRSISVEVDAPAATAVRAEVVDAFRVSFGDTGRTLRYDPLAAAREDGADWELSLAPGETLELWLRWD